MFWRILGKSLMVRKNHFVISVIAVTMGALLIAATSTISFNIKDKISRELRAYGPNLSILPLADALRVENGAVNTARSYLPLESMEHTGHVPDVLGASPVLEGQVKVTGTSVALNGVIWQDAQTLHPWWELQGKTPVDTGVGLGMEIAQKLQLSLGQPVLLTNGVNTLEATVTSLIKTGGDEDNSIFMDLSKAQSFLNLGGKISRIDVSLLDAKAPIETNAQKLEAMIPGSRAKIIQQVAQAEQNLLGKIQGLMIFVTIGVLMASLLSIAGTMTTTVLQRRKEIGIMKAIGAVNNEIAKLFLSEATIFGILGGILGLIAGFGLAQLIGITVFSTPVKLAGPVIPLTLVSACLMVWLASARPVLQAVSVEPASILRGE